MGNWIVTILKHWLHISVLLPSVKKDIPASKADFPMNFIMKTIPQEASPQAMPSKSDLAAYGKYLITAASCMDCHTRFESGKYVGDPFSGKREFKMPDGSIIYSANITPDKETGIGLWSKEMFIAKFKSHADTNYHPATVKTGQANTLMPWDNYGTMNSEDLGAIFTYLQTVKPVKLRVTHYVAPRDSKGTN
jgi:Cytochrome c